MNMLDEGTLYLTVPTVGPAVLHEMVAGSFVAFWATSSRDCRTIAFKVSSLIPKLVPTKPRVLVVHEQGLGAGVFDLLIREVPGDGSCEVISDRIDHICEIKENVDVLERKFQSLTHSLRDPAVIAEQLVYLLEAEPNFKPLLRDRARSVLRALRAETLEAAP